MTDNNQRFPRGSRSLYPGVGGQIGDGAAGNKRKSLSSTKVRSAASRERQKVMPPTFKLGNASKDLHKHVRIPEMLTIWDSKVRENVQEFIGIFHREMGGDPCRVRKRHNSEC